MARARTREFEPADLGVADVEPVDVDAADVEAADVEATEGAPADVEPAGGTPADVEPAEGAPADVEPADVEAAEGAPAEPVASLAPADPTPPPTPGRRALEEERDFCLRSLQDLKEEWEAGDIDAGDYRTLEDAYMARAAAALHALDVLEGHPASGEPSVATGDAGGAADGPSGAAGEARSGSEDGSGPASDEGSGPTSQAGSSTTGRRRPHPRRRIAIIACCVAAAAGAAAWAVVASSATRLPGQEITGATLGPEALAQSLQQAEQAANRGDDLTAVKDYQKILDSDPSQTEALTGEGWLLAQTQQPTILQQGLTMLQQAEQTDPTYAPAHVYRGIALLSEGNAAAAVPELKWYLAHNPDPQLAPQVRVALQQAEAQVAAASKG